MHDAITTLSKSKFELYINILSFLLVSSLTFSALSTFDCQFIQVNIGFEPNIESSNLILSTDSDSIRLGLWSCEVSTSAEYNSERKGGLCAVYADVAKLGNDVKVDWKEYENPYSHWLLNGDVGWTVSRLSAIGGGAFGLIATISILLLNFNIISLSAWTKELVLHSTGAAIACEAIKFGMFFNIVPCRSEIWPWETLSENGAIKNMFYRAQSCNAKRGCGASIIAFTCYLASMILLVGFVMRPKCERMRDDDETLNVPDNCSEDSTSTFSRLFAQDSHLTGTGSSMSCNESKPESGSKGTNASPSEEFEAYPKTKFERSFQRFECIREASQEDSMSYEDSSAHSFIDYPNAPNYHDQRKLETRTHSSSQEEMLRCPSPTEVTWENHAIRREWNTSSSIPTSIDYIARGRISNVFRDRALRKTASERITRTIDIDSGLTRRNGDAQDGRHLTTNPSLRSI